MSTTVTLSMSTLLIGVPSLVAFSGAVTFVALRGYLNDAVEGHRLLAAVDKQSSRWLFLKGYRKSPHAGPDLTDEPAPLALSDRSHADEQADHTDTDRPRWWASVVAFVVLAPLAFARRQLPVLVEWLAYRLKSQEQRDAEFAETYHRALEQARDAEYAGRRRCEEEAPVNPSYKSRHVHPDFATGAYQVINPSIPAQRSGDADADL